MGMQAMHVTPVSQKDAQQFIRRPRHFTPRRNIVRMTLGTSRAAEMAVFVKMSPSKLPVFSASENHKRELMKLKHAQTSRHLSMSTVDT